MGKKFLKINKKINSFAKKIYVDGDKSLSIRWALLASQGIGQSTATNILKSEDLLSTLNCLKKLGVKNNFKKKITLNAGNSGTLGRLILPLLIKSPHKIKIIGDKSLSKRDFSRVIDPLKKIGVNFYPHNKKKLPIYIKGSNFLRPINYFEKKGSAQCKSCVMLAALNTPGEISITAKKSRDHTERMFKSLKIPIKIKKSKKLDFIKVSKPKIIKNLNSQIPGDISSSAFFIVLTLLSKNSSLVIKNININPSRIGVIKILNKMGAKIKLKNIKNQNGEKSADVFVKSSKLLKGINCPSNLNTSAIDEFLIIFLAASKAKGVSYFKNLSELNEKESPRLKIASKILKMIGVRIISNNSSIKIYGNPNIKLNNKYIIKNYLKDHRVFMMCVIAALSLGGKWKIFDPESIKTSFPSFIKITKELGGKLN